MAYKIRYFKDDHGRILRVAIDQRGKVILEVADCGRFGSWIEYPNVRRPDPEDLPEVQSTGYGELCASAANCVVTRHNRRAG